MCGKCDRSYIGETRKSIQGTHLNLESEQCNAFDIEHLANRIDIKIIWAHLI